MIRVLAAIFAFLTVGCKISRVGELRKEFGTSKYLQTLDANYQVVEIRYLPPLNRKLERLGLADSVVLNRQTLDSLADAEPTQGLLLAMTLRPKGDSLASLFSKDPIYGRTSGYSDYRQALEAFQFGLKDRIWIEYQNRKVPLSHYHMENFFGMAPSRTFLLSFPNPSSDSLLVPPSFNIVLDDLVPGLSRRKIRWDLPIGEYDEKI